MSYTECLHERPLLTDTQPDENRSHLLEANVIQVVLSLLEAYTEKISAALSLPVQIPHFELKLLRTAFGALLNASLGYGADIPSDALFWRLSCR